MIVSELIELLQKEEPDSVVLTETLYRCRNKYDSAKTILKIRVKKNHSHTGRAYDYSGKYKEASIMDKKTDDELIGIRII